MKISVVTVSYNSADTIADTLRSVRDQSHDAVEHILIDGASTDQTMEQVRRHGGHLSHVVSEPDLGIYDAMNKGLRLATGDFVGFLNADDLLASRDTLALLAQAMPDADALYGDLLYVDATRTDKIVRSWISGNYSRRRLRFGWMPPHPTFYVRRSLLAGTQFNQRYRIAADYDFMLRCLLRPGLRVMYVPEVLIRMRTGGASNQSLKAMWRKSREDLQVMRANKVGGLGTLIAKNLRKLPQFIGR